MTLQNQQIWSNIAKAILVAFAPTRAGFSVPKKRGLLVAQESAGFSGPKTRASRALIACGLLAPKSAGFSVPHRARASRAQKTRASRSLIARGLLGPKNAGVSGPTRRHVVKKHARWLPCLTHASFSRITQVGFPCPTPRGRCCRPLHQHRHDHGMVMIIIIDIRNTIRNDDYHGDGDDDCYRGAPLGTAPSSINAFIIH